MLTPGCKQCRQITRGIAVLLSAMKFFECLRYFAAERRLSCRNQQRVIERDSDTKAHG